MRKFSNFDKKTEVIKENLKIFPLNRIDHIQNKYLYSNKHSNKC